MDDILGVFEERTNKELFRCLTVSLFTVTFHDSTHQSYTLIIKKFWDEKADARTPLNEDFR